MDEQRELWASERAANPGYNLRFNEDEVRRRLQGGARPSAANAQEYLAAYPGLADVLTPFLPQAAAIPGAPTIGTAPGAPTGVSSASPGVSPGGVANFNPQFNDIIAGLLNPPAQFADTARRAAEMGAGRGISGSTAAFGAGLRMTDEERLRRQALGAELLTGRETSEREFRVLDLRGQELELQRQKIEADIALGNRTAANSEALARIQRELAELERDKFNLQRTIQGTLGRATDASGNPTGPASLTGDQLLNTGMWVWG